MINNIAIFQTSEFVELCKAHDVKELYVFGSLARGSETEGSDVDLLVEVDEDDPIKKGKHLIDLYNEFQVYFNKKVDVVTPDGMKNPYFKKIVNESKILVYSRD